MGKPMMDVGEWLATWVERRPPINHRRVPVLPQKVEPEAFIEWGGPMPTQYDSAPYVGFETVQGNEQEVSRKVRTKRVENEDDPSQFVDVEVIDEITFQTTDGRFKTMTMNNNDSE